MTFEDERRAIQDALPEAVSIYGSQDLDLREQAIVDFSDGKFKYLSAKPVIAGSGCNFQRFCHKAIFVGIGFKFNDFILPYTASSAFCKHIRWKSTSSIPKPSAMFCAR